jgi:folate-binding protein YgfZ
MTSRHRREDMLFDLSRRAKLRITGSDRFRFLNGQVTNDVRKATESAAIEACVLNAKGRMNGHAFISVGPDCFLADAAPELRQALLARLGRYVIADDVEIEDVTDQWSLFHVLATAAPEAENGERILSTRRFVQPGWDLWVNGAKLSDSGIIFGKLSEAFHFVNSASMEVFRIEQGIPHWGRELTEEIIPLEANLEERTIDYEKGCYIGQEVISRMKMSGQTNKRLCGLISLSDAPLSPEMKLAATSEKGKEAGWITSVAASARLGKEIALGYVKRGFNNIGAKLDALIANDPDGATIPVEVVSLPFV